MSIRMIGIDHTMASVDIRSAFSFTKKGAAEAMEQIRQMKGIAGCVLLSTCNRMELWVSDDGEADLFEILCGLKQIDGREMEPYFIRREDQEAVEHLFYLTSGLKSQILGEDQILTQVKDALSMARECFAADSVLEVLFRMAVTAGKKIKTEIAFSHGNASVIHNAIHWLENDGYCLDGKVCMVIGNGEMGKVAANALREKGAKVTVTVRQYRSGIVQIPEGCDRIHYGERMSYLPACDLVVSATASPNQTLRAELFEGLELKKELILIDLALPRDIEPALGERDGIRLYDLDFFHSDLMSEENLRAMKEASALVEEQLKEFYDWLNGRDIIPRIQEIVRAGSRDVWVRVEKPVKKSLPSEELDKTEKLIETASGKVVGKMLFELRDRLQEDEFRHCLQVLENLYRCGTCPD